MKTSINEIKALDPCKSGYDRLLAQLGSNYYKEFEVSSLVGGRNTIADITWLMIKKGKTRETILFAVYCAELALPLCKDEHASKATEVTKRWLDDPSSVSTRELCAATNACSTAAAVTYDYVDSTATYISAIAAAEVYADANTKNQMNNKLKSILDSME